MNKIHYAAGAAIICLTALSSVLSACSSDDAVDNGTPQDKVVRVTANVGDMTTRGTYDTESLENMGFAIKNANSTAYSYPNVKFTKDGTSWTPASVLLWQDETQAVDIVAYAPYKDATLSGNLCDETQFPVEVQTVQTKDDRSSDFLVFKHAGFVPQNDLKNGAVAVDLSHAMTRLTVKVKFGTEYDAVEKLMTNPIKSLTIGGTVVKGTCDFTGTQPTVTMQADQAAETVTPYESVDFQPATGAVGQETGDATATYECILVPQSIAAGNFNVKLTMNGNEYTWTSSSDIKLNGNCSYTLTLYIGTDAIVFGNITVKPWADQGTTEKETE